MSESQLEGTKAAYRSVPLGFSSQLGRSLHSVHEKEALKSIEKRKQASNVDALNLGAAKRRGKKGGARPISMADHGRLGNANDALVMQNPMVAHPGAHHQPQAGVVTLKGDWIEATDPASGHKYWHNAQTGESTWVDPNAKDGKGIRRELSMG